MIKFTSFLPKILPIAGYYLQFLAQSGKFSQFFLSPHSYAMISKKKLKYSLEKYLPVPILQLSNAERI